MTKASSPSRVRGRIIRWMRFPLIAYAAIVLMFTFLQRSLIYHPDSPASLPARAVMAPGSSVSDVSVVAEDGLKLNGWYFSPSTAPERKPTEVAAASADRWLVLYFSGNAGHRGYRVDEAMMFNELGCDLLLVDYRGYGDNAGSPNEAALAEDALTVWNYARQHYGFAAKRILLCGESLGGGVAVRLAAELCQRGETPGGLVLRATFPSLVEVAGWHYPWLPVKWAMVERYPSLERIPHVHCPILHFHGDRDSIVPYALGRKLIDAAPAAASNGVPKQFVTIAGADHNDILDRSRDQVMNSLRDWLLQLGQPDEKKLPADPPYRSEAKLRKAGEIGGLAKRL
ncbi:MAG: alpha/beta hydrolase [Pirellulales bacterium]